MDHEPALPGVATAPATPVLNDTIPFPVTVRGELQGHAVVQAPKGWKDLWSSISAKMPTISEKKLQQLPAFKMAILANAVDFVVEKIISKFRAQPLGTVSKLIIQGVVTVITGVALQSMKTPLREFRQISSIDKQILVAGAVLAFVFKALSIVLFQRLAPAGKQPSSGQGHRAPVSQQQQPDSAPEKHKAAVLPQPSAVTIESQPSEPSVTPPPKAAPPALSPAPSTASSAVAMTPASAASDSSTGSQTSQGSTLSVDTTDSAAAPDAPPAPKTLTQTPNSRRQSRNSKNTPKTPKTPVAPKTPEKQAPEAPPAPEFSPRLAEGVPVDDNLNTTEVSKNRGAMSFKSSIRAKQNGLKKPPERAPGPPPKSSDPMSALLGEMAKRRDFVAGSRSNSPEKARKGHHRSPSDDFE